jgi:hypothetical protein
MLRDMLPITESVQVNLQLPTSQPQPRITPKLQVSGMTVNGRAYAYVGPLAHLSEGKSTYIASKLS